MVLVMVQFWAGAGSGLCGCDTDSRVHRGHDVLYFELSAPGLLLALLSSFTVQFCPALVSSILVLVSSAVAGQ